MNRFNYYAVWGTNSTGVFDDWNRANKSMKYVKKCRCRGFMTYKEAQETALEGYNELSGDDFKGPLPINLLCYKEQMNKIRTIFTPDEKLRAHYLKGEWVYTRNMCKVRRY